MLNSEFSDSFDTLLNSYASQAVFGDQAAHTEIVLDEYEKSVLLTQAQDNVIKSYFEKHTNQLGQGFDDSSRRQVDFSSLIKVDELDPYASTNTFDERGIIYKLPTSQAPDGRDYSRVLYILNEALISYTGSNKANFIVGEGSTVSTRMNITLTNNDSTILTTIVTTDTTQTTGTCGVSYTPGDVAYAVLRIALGDGVTAATVEAAIAARISGTAHANLGYVVEGQPLITTNKEASATLMPSGFTSTTGNNRRYVIIPINYKEYDREMSKPYAQPLKKQAWRLFQNLSTGYDIYSELIPIFNVDTSNMVYKIRYVERPTPIVLSTLPPNLSIDGYNTEQPCILNPIIHPEILHEAVRLAIESRASAVARAEAYQEAARRQPNT